MNVSDLVTYLEQVAPLALAESWDNVGLLLGDAGAPVTKIMTCLTLTPDVAKEAIEKQVSLVITHHPILFQAVKKLTSTTSEGAMILALARAGVAVYSAHTAFDSAWDGINQKLISKLGVLSSQPLKELVVDPKLASDGHFDEAFTRPVGIGRYGSLSKPTTLRALIEALQREFPGVTLGYVGDEQKVVKTIGVGCGSAAQFMDLEEVDVFITGEARFHDCLKARTKGIGLILLGHYASERFAMEQLADSIQEQFHSQGITAWGSVVEEDPLRFVRG